MRRDSRGFTLLEMAIGATVFVAAIAMSSSVVFTTSDALSSGMSHSALTTKANRLVDEIAEELMRAGASSIQMADTNGSFAISYRRATDYVDGAVQWSSPLRIEFRPAENRLVWIRNPGLSSERVVTWATDIRPYLEGEIGNNADDNENGVVDERGILFRLDGDLLTVSVSVEGRDPKGRFVVRTASSTFRLRN